MSEKLYEISSELRSRYAAKAEKEWKENSKKGTELRKAAQTLDAAGRSDAGDIAREESKKADKIASKRYRGVNRALRKNWREEQKNRESNLEKIRAENMKKHNEWVASKKLTEALIEEDFKMFQEAIDELVEEIILNELSKDTLRSYAKKAPLNLAYHAAKSAETEGPESDKHFEKAGGRIKGIKKAIDRLSEDQLNELSKDTLKSYIDKAKESSDDLHKKARSASKAADTLYNRGWSQRYVNKADEKSSTLVRKMVKRDRNIKKAKAKLNEDAINELSKETLGRYIRAAQHNRAGIRYDREDLKKRKESIKNRHADSEQDAIENYRAQKHIDKKIESLGDKSLKRYDGIDTALNKLTGKARVNVREDYINELSPQTLGSYINKASNDRKDLNHKLYSTLNRDDFNASREKLDSAKRGGSKSEIAKARKVYDKLHAKHGVNKMYRKAQKRDDSIYKAIRKLQEDSINEISKD